MNVSNNNFTGFNQVYNRDTEVSDLISGTSITTNWTMSKLMSLTEEEWTDRSIDLLNEKMEQYCEQCVPDGRTPEMAGFLEKHDLEPGADVAVIGDIHGNGLRLDLTLKALQKDGFLDEQFCCVPDKHIVFLGDYVDRGQNNLKVLELVITLKMENQDQVHLIRGNHEDLETSLGRLEHYAANDAKYYGYMQDNENLTVLNYFYNSLPVAVYLGQKTESEKRQYVQYSHGLFHLYTDPAPLFENRAPNAHLWVDGSPGFSQRIQRQMIDQPEACGTEKSRKQKEAMEKLEALQNTIPIRFIDIYWLDAAPTFIIDNSIGRVSIPPEITKAYLQISSTETAKVKEIMRGHQPGVWALKVKGKEKKVVVTTIDPSSNLEHQVFVEIKLADKVKNWSKDLVFLPMNSDHTQALALMGKVNMKLI